MISNDLSVQDEFLQKIHSIGLFQQPGTLVALIVHSSLIQISIPGIYEHFDYLVEGD
jgi:hypothetical protein